MAAQILRPYQETGVREILAAWRGGARRVLAVSPTGSGKTTLFTSILAEMNKKLGKRGAVLVHRRELADQASRRFGEFGVEFGVIMPGVPAKPYAPVQVAMVPTLARRELVPPADIVIADEAHLSTAETWQKVIGAYPRALILGVTATPWRLGGKPLSGGYDATVVISTPRELIAEGHLCGYQGFAYKAPSLKGLKKSGGDYNEKQLADRVNESGIVSNLIDEWKAHASHLSTLVFAVNVEHSQRIAREFAAIGVRAEHVDGTTPLEQRRAILARVASGETRVLCNVGVAVEGLDIPRLKCCVLARPTASLARALQMVGRVMRPWGGLTARIHDHAFIISQHGLPDQDRDYDIAAGELPDGVDRPPSLTTCKECFAVYEGAGACPQCGKAREVKKGELEELEAGLFDRVEISSGQGVDEEGFYGSFHAFMEHCTMDADARCTPQALCGAWEFWDPRRGHEHERFLGHVLKWSGIWQGEEDGRKFIFGLKLKADWKERLSAPPVEVRWTTPRTLEGVYRGFTEVESQWGSMRQHRLESGRKVWLLPGRRMLDDLLKNVAQEELIRVTYIGKEPVSTGREKQLFRVERHT